MGALLNLNSFQPNVDASGTWSDLLRITAIDQKRHAGVTVTSGVAAFTEILRDNASPLASDYYAALDLPAMRYLLQITRGGQRRLQTEEESGMKMFVDGGLVQI